MSMVYKIRAEWVWVFTFYILILTAGKVWGDRGAPYFSTTNVPMADAYATTVMIEGLEHPWGMAWLPDGRMLITERPGRLRVVTAGVLQSEPIQGLRVGVYLLTIHGELVFTSFDTDSPNEYDRYATREPGRYISRCQVPADFFNEGQYVLGMNASSFRVKRYFQDEHALTFTVDTMGAPGKQWAEVRLGTIRPRLNWQIEEQPF